MQKNVTFHRLHAYLQVVSRVELSAYDSNWGGESIL